LIQRVIFLRFSWVGSQPRKILRNRKERDLGTQDNCHPLGSGAEPITGADAKDAPLSSRPFAGKWVFRQSTLKPYFMEAWRLVLEREATNLGEPV
jgi:hypothetical protein